MNGVRVLAGADVYAGKRERFAIRTREYYQENEIDQKVDVYEDYRNLLERKDIDAVVISTPEHWHAIMAIEACRAGKDVYLEKPVSFTIKESQELVKAVRKHKRILAIGSQQRSDPNFINVNRLVHEDKIGRIEKIHCFVGSPVHPKPYDLPEEPVPDGLNWTKWLGPLPYYHFNKVLNPPVLSLNPIIDEEHWGGWRWYKELGDGYMTDWGAHVLDIAHWGIDADGSGPLRVIPAGYEGTEFLTYEYANGVELTVQPFNKTVRGTKFWGTEGWIEVARGHFKTSMEDLKKDVKEDDVPYEGKAAHHVNFIQAVKERKDPTVPVEIGHSTCVACTLGNIAHELKRPVNWNPEKESFVNDPEATKYLHYEYQKGYSL
jgi:predicted dehydrogenase